MVFRHVIFAGLLVCASAAQASLLEATSVPAPPRLPSLFMGGTIAMPAALTAQQMMSASGGSWSMHRRAGDVGGTSRMLFSGGAKAGAFTGAPSVPDVVQAAPPTGGTFTNGPEDTSSLGNGGVTGGPSQPPPFTDIAHGGGNDTPAAIPPATELAEVIVNLPADLPAVVAPALVPEPATGALLLAGMLGAGALRRRRK